MLGRFYSITDPGCVVVVLAGSVQTIAEKIDIVVWRALATRAGGEAVDSN